MSTQAEIIDQYFRSKNYYDWIPYEPIGQVLVEEIERQGSDGLYVSTAAALIEQETGGKNLFGCDWGSEWVWTPPYCQVAVTRDRVQKLIANVEAGGGQNGVGLTQLTSVEYVYAAENMGGAHLPRYQMRVGFEFLLRMVQDVGWPHGAAAYNAGRTNYRSVMDTYGASMERLEKEWASRLSDADIPSRQRYVLAPNRALSHKATADGTVKRINAAINGRPGNLFFEVTDTEEETT